MANFILGTNTLKAFLGQTDADVYKKAANTIDFDLSVIHVSDEAKYYRHNVTAYLQKKVGTSWSNITSKTGYVAKNSPFKRSFDCNLLQAGTYRIKVDFYRVATGASNPVYIGYNATYGFTVQAQF